MTDLGNRRTGRGPNRGRGVARSFTHWGKRKWGK